MTDRLREALRAAIKIADEARNEWDAAPSSMKAGKLLIALSGHLPGYRPDIDEIHAALRSSASAREFETIELIAQLLYERAPGSRDRLGRLRESWALRVHSFPEGCERYRDDARAIMTALAPPPSPTMLAEAEAEGA